MDDIKKQLGDQNEKITRNDLKSIEDEIDSMIQVNQNKYYKDFKNLAILSIKKGKPEVFEYLVLNCQFDQDDIIRFNKEIQEYEYTQLRNIDEKSTSSESENENESESNSDTDTFSDISSEDERRDIDIKDITKYYKESIEEWNRQNKNTKSTKRKIQRRYSKTRN